MSISQRCPICLYEHDYATEAEAKSEYKIWENRIEVKSILLKLFMESNCRLSNGDKWIVKGDTTASWHVYQQKYHQKVKRILITDDLQKALTLLSEQEEDL